MDFIGIKRFELDGLEANITKKREKGFVIVEIYFKKLLASGFKLIA